MRSVTIAVAGVIVAGVLAGCGSSTTPVAAVSSSGMTKGQKALAQYRAAMLQVAADNGVVEIELGGLAQTPPTSTLVDVASAATTAHTDLQAARDSFTGSLDLFTAASDLTAAMGTLGNLTSNPNDAGIAGKYKTDYATAAGEWNSAVDAVAVSGGVDGKQFEVAAGA